MSAVENICRTKDLSFSFVTGTSAGGPVTIGDIFSQKIRVGESGTAVGRWGNDCVRKAGVAKERELEREK